LFSSNFDQELSVYSNHTNYPQQHCGEPQGIRTAAIDYFVSCGISPIAARAQVCALSATVTMGLADICWPNGMPVVLGCPTIRFEESGGGKSVMSKTVFDPVKDYVEDLDLPEVDTGPKQKLEGAITFIEDVTREAIIDAVVESNLVVLHSTEGAIALQLLRTAAPWMTKLLDGEGLKHARRSSNRRVSISKNARLAFHVAVQHGHIPEYAEHIRSKRGGVGIENRILHFLVPSTAFNGIHRIDPNAPALRAIALRGIECVREAIFQACEKRVRPRLRLSKHAAEFLNHVDHEARAFAQNQPQSYVKNYLTRHAERVLRESGSQHVFEYDAEAEVELATLQNADQIGRTCCDAFCSLTYEPPKPTKAEIYASMLDGLLRSQLSYGHTRFPLAKLKKYAPNAGLTASQLNVAIPVLCSQGKAFVDGDVLHFFPYGTVSWNGL
jgi:hypothetical protein